MGILIIKPGMQCLLQDGGRFGHARFGVARSGAFDLASWRRANQLVGNPIPAPNEIARGPASLELLVGGLEFITTTEVTLAIAGADCATTTADPAGQQHQLEPAAAHHLQAGVTVSLARAKKGLRTYVALSGGIDAPLVLGSRSYDTTAQLGPLPLVAGTELAIAAKTQLPERPPGDRTHHDTAPTDPWTRPIRLVVGPETQLTPNGLASLTSQRWKVTPNSSRAGIRLISTEHGPNFPPLVDAGTLPSAPTIAGAIQALPSGELVVLGPDGPTTGGYPIVAIMSRSDLSRLSQIRPGSTVEFDTSDALDAIAAPN